MKTRIFTFLVAFLATMSGAVWGQDYTGTIDISGSTPTITSETDDISVDGNHIEISGDGNYLIKGDGTAKDYYIETNGDPTITLQDVYLKHEGDPIMEINKGVDGDVKLILIGTNTFESDEEIGIRCTAETNVTILDSSTGILTFKTDIGIGNNIGMVGDVAINGGTVIFDTKGDAISGTVGGLAKHDFTMNGRGVVIINKPFDKIDFDTDDIEGGIIFDNTASDKTGHMFGDVTLNSPLDLTDEGLSHLDLNGGTLTVGENGVLNAEYQDIRNGKISGFGIKYDANRISDCTSKDETVPTDYNFYPTTTEVTLGKGLTCSAETSSGAGKHQFLGWVYNNKVYAAESTITMNETAKTYTLDEHGNVKEGDFVTLKGAWAVEEISLTINNNEAMIEHTLAASPSIVSYGTVSDGLPSGITFTDGKFSGTATLQDTDFDGQESKVYTVTVPITAEGTTGKTATVKIIVNKTIPDLNKATVSIKTGQSYIYNGRKKEAVEVKVNDVTLREDIHYTITYTWKKNEEAQETEVTEINEAGTYTIKNITAKEGQAEGTLSGQLPTDAITVSPRELNLQIKDQEIKLNETIATPSSDNIEVRDDESDENDYFISSDNAATITYSGALTGTTNKVGEHELSKGTDFAIATITVNGKDVTHNYKLGDVNAGTLTVKKEGSTDDPINPGDSEEEDTEIIIGTDDNMDGWTWVADNERYERTYDGNAHPITSIRLKYQNEEGEKAWETLSLEKSEFSVTYEPNEDVKDYKENGYTATITISGSKYYSGTATIKLFINKADFSVTAGVSNTISVVQNADISQLNAADYITITGVNDEKPNISGYLTPNTGVSTTEKNETGIEDAFSFNNVEVENSDNCLLSNYNEVEYPQIKLIVGPITIDPDTDGSGDGDDEVIGGEDADGDRTFPTDGDIILLATGDAQVQNNVYDGNAHRLALLKIGKYTLAEKTDYIVSYNSSDEPSLNEADLPFHAATYSADIKLNDNSAYELNDGSKEFTLNNVTIAQRPMLISFVKEVASVEDLNDITKLVQFEEMVGNRGLVDGEEPTVEAEDIMVKDLDNGLYQVTIPRESFKVSTNKAGNFYLSDYSVKVDFDGDGQEDADITDNDNDGTGEIGDNEGGNEEDITIEITVDPDNDDNQGGNWNDYPDYYNIYVDTCQGVWLERSTKVVREGNSVRIKVEIEEGTDTTNLELKFKRGLFGYWEDLTQFKTETPDEYLIKNIYTDIYVMAKGAVPTGIEDIDGVQAKVYSKDGSIYVQTPKQEQVLIISISGAIVKNEKQIGLQRYDGLQRGVYVVKVGKQVFKIRN